MSSTGDDCYFYYYSTCAKGDECPFRHQPAALGCELTCHHWQRGTCFKKACSFRHMVIEKDRSTIQCVWENQPSGCMKPHCPFQHTKPQNIPSSQPQSIPNLGSMPPAHPANVGRGGPGMRPPMYNNNPPRPNVPPMQVPFMGGPRPMQQRPMGYDGYIPQNRPSNPFVYQMHHNSMATMSPYSGLLMTNMMMSQPRADYLMVRRGERPDLDDSDEDYTSTDYSDVSLSDDDDRRTRSRDSSRRRVQSPRSSSKREVRPRSDREKKTESRSSRDSYNDRRRDSNRRRRDSDKDRTNKDSERNRTTRPRRQTENKESSPSSSSSEIKKVPSDVKIKNEAEDAKEDIKVKTLEEILREKALKNLHERTALKKKQQMEQAENAKKDPDDDDDTPEPILKSVVSVSKAESTSSQKVSEPREFDDEVLFVKEKKAKSPKKIVLDDVDPESEAGTATNTLTRQVKIKEESTTETVSKTEKTTETGNKAVTSNLSNVKVKTLREVLEEKRKRKLLENMESLSAINKQPSEQESKVAEDATSEENIPKVAKTGGSVRMVSLESKPTRKIQVLKKNENEQKPTGKVVIRRKVSTSPIKGAVGETNKQDQQETKANNPSTQEKFEPTKNILVKSFDMIMKEKNKRKQMQTQPTQEVTTATTTTTAKRPTIIRKKHIPLATHAPSTTRVTTATSVSSTTSSSAPIRTFKSRKLKVISRLAKDTISEPGSPTVSNPLSPTSTQSDPTTPTSPSATHQYPSINNSDAVDGHKDDNDDNDGDDKNEDSDSGNDDDRGDDDDSDDDSWEHEELPAVPLETPTLEGPAPIPDIPKDATILHIPGKVVDVTNNVSPIKRPRSSLEEIFGVPCDDTNVKQDKHTDRRDGEDKYVSPAKKVKTTQEAVNKAITDKDDFDLDLDEEIANLPANKSYEAHDSLNEDDLLLELEEMINN